jgi:hypothetical protein
VCICVETEYGVMCYLPIPPIPPEAWQFIKEAQMSEFLNEHAEGYPGRSTPPKSKVEEAHCEEGRTLRCAQQQICGPDGIPDSNPHKRYANDWGIRKEPKC